MTRDFYGTLRVKDAGPINQPATVRRLIHGVIMHGEQYLDPTLRRLPTSYYGPDSGVGLAIRCYQDRPLRMGVIGLGTGTLAAWGKPGDSFRFYELDPRVLEVAKREFTYLADSKAKIEFSLGDARLNLEREPPNHMDILARDAFSSDSIPIHLITREALAVYLRHMQPNGIIAFHVTNRYLDLPPVVQKLADDAGLKTAFISHDPKENDARYSRTDWILLTRDESFLASDRVEEAAEVVEVPANLTLWTDDFNNLLRILK
jgi:SAM-dependent methyltransferase